MNLWHTTILTVSNGFCSKFNNDYVVSQNKLSVLKLWRKAFTSIWRTDILTVSNGVLNIFNIIIGFFILNWVCINIGGKHLWVYDKLRFWPFRTELLIILKQNKGNFMYILSLHKLWRKSFRVYEWQSEILTVLNGVSLKFIENNGISDNNW